MIDIVARLKSTLTSEPSDDALWDRVVAEREEAAAEIERLRAALGKINVGDGWAALIARTASSQIRSIASITTAILWRREMTAFTYDKQKNPKSNKTLEKWRFLLMGMKPQQQRDWLSQRIISGRDSADSPAAGFDVFDLAGIIFTLETWLDQVDETLKQEAA